MGMGRGAGNLKTEQIYNFLNPNDEIGKDKINLIKKKIFLNLKKKYKWGTNKYYSFAAKNSIHPTYVQELISNKSLTDIYRFIDQKKYDIIKEVLIKMGDNKFLKPIKLALPRNFSYFEIKISKAWFMINDI